MLCIEPVGAKSRKNLRGGQEPNNTVCFHDALSSDWLKLHDGTFDDAMSESEQAFALSALRELMQKAIEGVAKFPQDCSARESHDADQIQMKDHTFLLELRQPHIRVPKPRFGKPRRVVRLYYFEPRLGDHDLYNLHIASKPSGVKDEEREQDASIRAAGVRAWSVQAALNELET